MNSYFKNKPPLEQIRRLHQQIHQLDKRISENSGNFPSNLTYKSIVFVDANGDATEDNANLIFESATIVVGDYMRLGSNRVRWGLVGDDDFAEDWGGDRFRTKHTNTTGGGLTNVSTTIGGTGAVPIETLDGQILFQDLYRTRDSNSENYRGGVTTRLTKDGAAHKLNWKFDSGNLGESILEIGGENDTLKLNKYGKATPTQTIANTGGTYTNNSTIPFFSNEGILTESDDFFTGKNTSGSTNSFLSIGGVKDVPLNTGNSTFVVFEATNPAYANTFAVTDDQTFLYKGSHGYQAFHISIHGGTDNRNAATFDPVGRAGASPGGYRISAATNGSGTGSTGDFQVSMLAEVNVEEDGLNMKLSNGPFTNQDTYTWITLLAKNKAIQFARFNRPTLEQTTADTNGNYTKRSTIPFFSDEGTVTESSNIVLGHSSLYATRNAQLLINHQDDSMSGWTTFAAQAGENTSSGAMQIQVNDGGFELAGYKNQGSNFNRYYSTGTVAETITETTPLITAGQGIAQNIFWVKHNGLSGQKLFGRDSVTVNTVRPDGYGNVDFKWFTNKSVGTGVQDQELLELKADGHIIFHQYGTGIQDATTLSKTPSTGLAQFATDGTVLDKAISVQASTAAAAADGTLLTNEVFMVTNGDGTSALHIKN